ncbi:MAG TPA: DEAD/DEAH box helicase, partial [Kofleriaceae bacterium]|nr:DEAD/DEAH box helicase [Kofleriaceae bacterium]
MRWGTGPTRVPRFSMPFSSAHPSLQNALTARGYAEPTPVQAAILAPDVDQRDVLVSAQTGSGKTVAFGLAVARTLLGEAARFTAGGAPRALIVTPTRELAMQVHRELSWLYAETGARITTCVGGMDPRRESHALHHGVHIVVGTPGRLCDHLARGSLALDRVAVVVLDEADEMLDMGFREDLERLLDAAPKERRTLMFSATIPAQIATLAKRYQRDAMRIATSGANDRHRDIAYQVVSIVPRERDLAVVNLLRFHDAPGALVFCGTRDGVTHLAANLSERGFSVAALSGELSQRERNQALQALRDGRARVCVATDVAARGLDLPDLGLVIHADLPQSKETLVHRSGRTGRAGKKGLAILIAVDAARRYVERLLYSARIEATWGLAPSSDDIRDRDQQHLAGEIQALTDDISDADRDVARTLLAGHPAEDLVAALVHLRREARPAPEELSIPPSMRPRRPAGPPGSGDRFDRNDRGDRFDRPRYDHATRVPPRGRDERAAHDGHAAPAAHAQRPTPNGHAAPAAHAADALPVDRVVASGHAADALPADRVVASGHAAGALPADRVVASGHAADVLPADRVVASGHMADALPADRVVAGGHAVGAQPADRAAPMQPADRVVASGHAADVQPADRVAVSSHAAAMQPVDRAVPDGEAKPASRAEPIAPALQADRVVSSGHAADALPVDRAAPMQPAGRVMPSGHAADAQPADRAAPEGEAKPASRTEPVAPEG